MKDKGIQRVARVQEILRRWDPIDVRPGEMAPGDEYDSYALHIVSMVARGGALEELAIHLEEIRVDTIGVGADPVRDREIAAEVINALRTR